MRDAVICEPLRTPVGGFGGSLRDVPAHDARRHGHPGADRAHRPRRRRRSTTCSSATATRRWTPRRSAGSPRSTPACRSPRPGCRSTGAAARACRPSSTRRCRCRRGASERRARRRRRVDEQRAVLLDRDALGRQGRPASMLHDALARGPGHRRRRQLPGARRHDRDGREPAPRVRHRRARSRTSTPCAATSGPPPRADAGRFDDEIVPVTVPGRKGDTVVDSDEHSAPDTTLESLAHAAPGHGQGRPGRDGHRRQRQRPERRRRGLPRHHAGEGRRARAAPAGAAGLVGRRRGAAEDHGHRPGPATAKALARPG